MIIFFFIAFTIYSLLNIYLFYKGYNAIPVLKAHRLLYSLTFFLLAVIFIFAKILESKHSSVISDILNIIGGFWLAFMFYGFLFFLISDILLLTLKITGLIGSDNIIHSIYNSFNFHI